MPLVFIRHIGRNLAYVHDLEGVDPGFGVGSPGVDPGYGHPIFGHPDHGLPGYGHPGNRPPGSGGGGHIDNALPGAPGSPGNELPAGAPGSPGNELPAGPPPHVNPGQVLVLVRDQAGVWHYAATAPGTPPPTTLPEPPGVGVWPKPQPPVVDNTLPTPPVTPGTPLPPTPAPKR